MAMRAPPISAKEGGVGPLVQWSIAGAGMRGT
jgi:hypothetical protein